MGKNLVIVESPTKAKTIEKFLGKDFKVLSSYGHIRDLKKKSFSIDIEDDFNPDYEIPSDKKSLVNTLKAESQKADFVWIASDEDREGEAIAWHLYEVLQLQPRNTKRIVFHEITKGAILEAIKNPRDIDMNLVNAQQARRILDRIVGFELSPVLWKKVKPSLSAGRVQSVAVRLIVEREREIRSFHPHAAYKISALFLVDMPDGETVELKAELGRKINSKDEVRAFLTLCDKSAFVISDIVTKPVKKSPSAPFTTSTLQQEAAHKLGFTVSQTMMVAQHLYESGYITYMRTDSVNLSQMAIATGKATISEMMGVRYVHPRQYKTKSKGAQEAHEAIRPTYMAHHTIQGNAQERKLYDLIWKRTIASQMADAELERTIVSIAMSNADDMFTAVGQVVRFDGFLRVYNSLNEASEERETGNDMLPVLTKGQKMTLRNVTAIERFTQRPLRYNEASLVRKLEELGIGRPSTYAPTISTIQHREYVEKGNKEGEKRKYNVLTLQHSNITECVQEETTGVEKAKLFPTDTGVVVTDFLLRYFPDILDYNFTANIEKEFDEIAEGKTQWKDCMHNFYSTFHPSVEETLALKTGHKVGERVLGIDPKTGKTVSVKIGRYGPMVQLGTAEDEEKPRFASLRKDQSLETLTLPEAMDLFKLPRVLGFFEGETVSVNIGRFGPYVQCGKMFASLPKGEDPLNITLGQAESCILAKRAKDTANHIKVFDCEPKMEILNGRYGPYITYKGNNYKIPKGMNPQEMTMETCLGIITKQSDKPKTDKGYKRGKAKKQ